MLGRYELVRVLGQGGMGTVFEANLLGPSGFRKPVALKVLRRDLPFEPAQAREELAREARIGALLAHPNVVHTYELDIIDDQLCVAMQKIDGLSVFQLLVRRRPLPIRAALDVMTQTCAGLHHAHTLEVDGRRAELVHRDLKPGNLLIDRWGMLHIADFGIAAVRPGAGLGDRLNGLRGTPSYMAPEQLRQGDVDERADVWAAGIILYEVAVGRRPWRFADAAQALVSLPRLDGAMPEMVRRANAVLPGLGAVVAGCLEPERDDRISTAEALRRRLMDLRRKVGGASLEDLLYQLEETDSQPPTPRRTGLPTVVDQGDAWIPRPVELAALQGLRRGPARLICLRGPTGSGKSRLARRWLAHDGGTAAAMVDLTGAQNRAGVLDATAAALGFNREGASDSALERRILAAVTGIKGLVLCLDNLESVLDDARGLVRKWLDRVPTLHIAATTSQSLGLPGEAVLDVPPLSTGQAVALLTARAAALDEPLDEWKAKSPCLAALASRLDHLPLALELAASHAEEIAPGDLLEQLQAAKFAQAGATDATLQAALALSWGRLGAFEQQALAQLSVFEGAFDLAAAHAVLDLEEAAGWPIHLLIALNERSLLRVIEGGRFALLHTVRRFARWQLQQAGELGPTRLRHAGHMATVELGPTDAEDFFSNNRHWLPDLEQAAAYAASVGAWTISAHVALRLAWLVERPGPYDDAIALLERILPTCGAEPELGRQLLERSAALHIAKGDHRGASSRAEQLLAAAREAASPRDELAALQALASAAVDAGTPKRADALYREALDLAVRTGHVAEQGALLLHVAWVDIQANQGAEAFELTERARDLGETHGLPGIRARVESTLGTLASRQGDQEASLRHAKASLRLNQRAGDRRRQASNLVNIAISMAYLGRHIESEQTYLEAELLCQDIGLMDTIIPINLNLSNVLRRMGRVAEARARCARARTLAIQLESTILSEIALGSMGLCDMVDGKWELAATQLCNAADRLADRERAAAASYLGCAAECFARLRREDDAHGCLDRADTLMAQATHAIEALQLTIRRTRVQHLLDRPTDDAWAAVQAAITKLPLPSGSSAHRLLEETREMLGRGA